VPSCPHRIPSSLPSSISNKLHEKIGDQWKFDIVSYHILSSVEPEARMRADEVIVLIQPECEWSVNVASCFSAPSSWIKLLKSRLTLELLPCLYYSRAASAHNCRRQRASYDFFFFSAFDFKSEINTEL